MRVGVAGDADVASQAGRVANVERLSGSLARTSSWTPGPSRYACVENVSRCLVYVGGLCRLGMSASRLGQCAALELSLRLPVEPTPGYTAGCARGSWSLPPDQEPRRVSLTTWLGFRDSLTVCVLAATLGVREARPGGARAPARRRSDHARFGCSQTRSRPPGGNPVRFRRRRAGTGQAPQITCRPSNPGRTDANVPSDAESPGPL